MGNAQTQAGTSVAPVRVSPKWTTIVAAPVLYVMIIPLVFFDLSLEFYHRLAFPLLGIPMVRRREYVKLDRHRLPYLPAVLKLACMYCSYANGLIQYAARIAGETETYFCPIKHQAATEFHPPPHHRDFVEYGDAEAFRRRYQGLRSKGQVQGRPAQSPPAEVREGQAKEH
jgi:hypothetical protein